MNIESHFDLILNNYKLTYLFRKFLGLSILTTTIKESFYWSLIYFSEIVKDRPDLITKFSITLILFLFVSEKLISKIDFYLHEITIKENVLF